MPIVDNRVNLHRSTNGECGNAYDNGIMKLTEPTTPKRAGISPMEESSLRTNDAGFDRTNQITHEAYDSRKKALGKGWDYIYPDKIMLGLADHAEYSDDLAKLRQYSPYDHAVTKQWAEQVPVFDASNNYIYAHDHQERMTEENLTKLNKGVFTLPNMPLNRDKDGKKNSYNFGDDRNARAVKHKPGVGSDHSISPYFLDRIKQDGTPFYIGRLDGGPVVYEPDFKHRPVDSRFYNGMASNTAEDFFKYSRNAAFNNLYKKDSYYLSLCPVDEDYRPCEGTVWYNTSEYGVAIMTRDGFNRVVLPNMSANEIAEALLNNDFALGDSSSVADTIGNRKGLWALRTIQGGLDSLRENLRTLGLLDRLDKKVDDDYLGKERSRDALIEEDISGVGTTIGEIRRSFGNFEELIKALDEMEPPMSTRDRMVENSSHYVYKPNPVFLRPFTNGVIYGVTIAFFIKEEDIRKSRSNKKAMYDPTLDVLINPLFKENDGMVDTRRYGTVTPILHPHVYNNIVRKIAIRQHNTSDVASLNLSHFARDHRMPSLYSVGGCVLVSQDTQTLYKRAVVGNESSVVEIKSLIDRNGNELREGISGLREGVYILQDFGDLGEMVQIRIDIHDKDKLKEHGIYFSKEDAEAYIVIKRTEALEASLKEKELEIEAKDQELKEAKIKQGNKTLDHENLKLDYDKSEMVLKVETANIDRDRKSRETVAKSEAEKYTATSNMFVAIGSIFTGMATVGALTYKIATAKAATTAAITAGSAVAAGTTATSVGVGLGAAAKIGTAIGTAATAVVSSPVALAAVGVAAVAGVCSWLAGWFD
nr:MAG TPA: hypothetical protein [Bacteriophage sp.]